MRTARKAHLAEPDPSLASSTYQPQTDLGRRLWELRQRVLAVEKPLDWKGIEQELAERRGERKAEP
jgi:hypothetical protein